MHYLNLSHHYLTRSLIMNCISTLSLSLSLSHHKLHVSQSFSYALAQSLSPCIILIILIRHHLNHPHYTPSQSPSLGIISITLIRHHLNHPHYKPSQSPSLHTISITLIMHYLHLCSYLTRSRRAPRRQNDRRQRVKYSTRCRKKKENGKR